MMDSTRGMALPNAPSPEDSVSVSQKMTKISDQVSNYTISTAAGSNEKFALSAGLVQMSNMTTQAPTPLLHFTNEELDEMEEALEEVAGSDIAIASSDTGMADSENDSAEPIQVQRYHQAIDYVVQSLSDYSHTTLPSMPNPNAVSDQGEGPAPEPDTNAATQSRQLQLQEMNLELQQQQQQREVEAESDMDAATNSDATNSTEADMDHLLLEDDDPQIFYGPGPELEENGRMQAKETSTPTPLFRPSARGKKLKMMLGGGSNASSKEYPYCYSDDGTSTIRTSGTTGSNLTAEEALQIADMAMQDADSAMFFGPGPMLFEASRSAAKDYPYTKYYYGPGPMLVRAGRSKAKEVPSDRDITGGLCSSSKPRPEATDCLEKHPGLKILLGPGLELVENGRSVGKDTVILPITALRTKLRGKRSKPY